MIYHQNLMIFFAFEFWANIASKSSKKFKYSFITDVFLTLILEMFFPPSQFLTSIIILIPEFWFIISIKIHFLLQNVVSFWTISSCWEIFKKRFLVEIKVKYFLLEPKCGAWRQNGGRLGDVTEARRSFLRGSWRLYTPSLTQHLLHTTLCVHRI